MTAKEIYESLDLTQLPDAFVEKVKKVEQATKGFTIQSDKVDAFMKGAYDKIKKDKPTALKNLKVEEKVVKKEIKTEKATKIVEDLEYKIRGKKSVTKKTPTPSAPKRKENTNAEAKRTKKKGETFKEAVARVQKEREAAAKEAEKVVSKTAQALKNLEDLLANDPKLAGYPRTYGKQSKNIDASKDSKIKARPAGKRVSKKGHKNQYGPSKGGRVYWENRDNRSDRFAPDFPDKIYLEMGGETDDLGFPTGHTYLVIEVSPSGDKKLIKSTKDYMTALMSSAVARGMKSSKDARVVIVDKEDKKVIHESFEAGGEIVITPTSLINNPDYLVGTTTMTELFECGGVTAYQEGGEVFVTPSSLLNAGSADYVAGSNTMSNMFEDGGKLAKGGFIAMYNGKKAEIEADTLLEAKKKAIEKLNVPKSKQGLLSVVPNSFMENEDFRFMAKGGKLPKNITYYGVNEIKEYRLKNGDKIDPSKTFVDSGVYVSATKTMKPKEEEFQQKLEFKKGGATNWKGEKINWKEDYIYIPRFEVEEVELENGKVIKGDYVISGLYLPKSDRTKLLEKEMKGRMNKMETGGYVVVGDKDGFWSVVSTPVSKAKAEELLKDTTFPKGEKGKIVSVAEAMSHKKVIGKEYLESGGTIVAADPSAAMEDLNQTYGYESVFEKGGRLGFDGLAKKVAKRYEGQKVPSKFRKEYGKTYSKEEAMEVGRKVAAKVYGQQQANMKKMADGGSLDFEVSEKMAEMAFGSEAYNAILMGLQQSMKGGRALSSVQAKKLADEFASMAVAEKKAKYSDFNSFPVSFAKGGSLEGHGLKDGDVIINTSEEFIKVLDKDGVPFFVNLADGYRGKEKSLPFAEGGKLKSVNIPEIAKKFGKSTSEVFEQIQIGEKHEMEHTNDPKKARKIALDHLSDDMDYYKKLKKLGL